MRCHRRGPASGVVHAELLSDEEASGARVFVNGDQISHERLKGNERAPRLAALAEEGVNLRASDILQEAPFGSDRSLADYWVNSSRLPRSFPGSAPGFGTNLSTHPPL